MKFFVLFACLFACSLGSDITLSYGGSGITCTDVLEFDFTLPAVKIENVGDGLVSIKIPELTMRMVKGEADLPVLREFVALTNSGEWKVVVEDVVTTTHDLEGKRVAPSKGQLFLEDNPDDFPLVFGDSYLTDSNLPTAMLHTVHKMRDVFGTILEINPVKYHAPRGELEIMTSCKLKLVSVGAVSARQESKVVDATFYDLYEFHYLNFHHFAGSTFIKGDDLGRMIVFYDSKFKDAATKFAATKKDLKDVILAPCSGQASSLKATAKQHYQESDGLTYMVLFGTNCPTFNCQKSRRECDVQYAMMSSLENDVTLDIFVSRMATDSTTDSDALLAKFAKYESLGRNLSDWQHSTAGLALDLIGDEYQVMHRNLDKMTKSGFSVATYMQDNSATSSQVMDLWNKGLGMYYYIGHGSGTKWNCPQRTGGMSESDIRSKMHNSGMYPFVLECACLNGGFKKESPCFAAAMMNKPDGGAISMYSSAPVAQSSSPKDLQSGATDLIVGGKATRVGPIYYGGIMYAYKLKPSQCLYTLQGYNMFGDPSIQLNFLRK